MNVSAGSLMPSNRCARKREPEAQNGLVVKGIAIVVAVVFGKLFVKDWTAH